MSSEVTKEAESGFIIEREYKAARERGWYETALGAPGAFPYTRHVRPEGYRDRPWQPSLYSGHGLAPDANRRFKFLLEEGNGRVSIAFDLPTQMGLDSDAEFARHEVGRVGVAIDSLRDFETLLDSIPIDRIPVTMNMNALAPTVIAMLVSVARRRGVDLASLRGTISNDVLNEIACRGLLIWDTRASVRLMIDTAQYVIENLPGIWAFNVRGALLHEIGATPAQELGITMAMSTFYIDQLVERGIDPARAASRMSLFFSSTPKFLEDAAKFRAARRMWARTLHERYGIAKDNRALKLRMTAVACNGSHFQRPEPELNLVRSTLGVLACALGGVQTMVGTAIDEAYEIPSDRSQELALRVQQIVALESDVCATVDPLGGSFFIEEMTDRIEEEAARVIEEIDETGGIVEALDSNRIQSQMREQAYDIQQQIESAERPVVGVNVHPSDTEAPELDLWQPQPGVVESQSEVLAEVRRRRDQAKVDAALAGLAEAAADPAVSIMPAMIEAVESYATVGEISNCLTSVLRLRQEAVAGA